MSIIAIKKHVFDRHALPVFETNIGNFIALHPIAAVLDVSVNPALENALLDVILDQFPSQSSVHLIHDDSDDNSIDREVVPLDMAIIELLLAKSKSPRVQRLRRFFIDTVLPAHRQNATQLLMQRLKATAVYSASYSGFVESHQDFFRNWQIYLFRINPTLAH